VTLTIVTSFNRHIWNNHGKTCIESWIKHLYGPLGEEGIAPDYQLHLYIDGPIPTDLPKGDNIKVHWLDNEPEYTRFLTETRDVNPNPNIPSEHKFRFEFRRFWPKVFSIKHAFRSVGFDDWLLWLDADILFKKDLSLTEVTKNTVYLNEKIQILDRGHPWNYMDSGYVLLRRNGQHDIVNDSVQTFVDAIYNIYTTKTIFRFTEWHDAFLMSQVMNILWGEDKGNFVKSLSGMSSSLHPLDDSWLRDYMVHLKGGLKHGVTQSFEGQEREKEITTMDIPRRTDV